MTGNGAVDIFDLLQFRSAFGSEEGDADYNAAADHNGDGKINVFDLLPFRSNFGTSI